MSELNICKVTGSETGNPRNLDTGTVTYLQVKNGGGVKKIQLYGQAGVDQTPQPDDVAVKMLVGESQTAIIATADQIAPSTDAGEREHYSYDANATKLARHKLKSNGKQLIKNEQTGDDLKTALQTLIQGIQSATYIPYPGGVAGPPVPIVDASGKIAQALTALANILDSTP